MATKFKEGVGWKRKTAFHVYAFALNSTEIGVWAAAAITTSVASNLVDFSPESVVKKGAKIAACYLCPAAPVYTVIKNVDKAVAFGKKASLYGSLAYKAGTMVTAPIEFVNYVGAKVATKVGLTEGVKKMCGVEESDCFYWERAEYQDRV